MITLTRRKFIASFGALAGGALVGVPAAHVVAATSTTKNADVTTALPDLVVTELIIPAGMVAGQAVEFGAIVKNQGTARTPQGTLIGVGFHVDGIEVTWSGTHIDSLKAGGIAYLYATSGYEKVATWVATAGEHTLTAIVNDVHRFAETSTSNNSLSYPFTVAAATTKPTNVTLPVITGTPAVGNVLTTSTGTWK